MTKYVYEAIPTKASEAPRYFEIPQDESDAPLTKHPETGEPIRRVVLGGFGTLSSKPSTSGEKDAASSCCGPKCCCG